jgi:hypothetical protein
MTTGTKQTSAHPPIALSESIRSQLVRLRARQIGAWVAGCLAVLAACLPAALFIQGLADWLLNLPWAARAILLAADAVLTVWIVRRFLVEPMRRGLSLKQVALWVERGIPEFRSTLISTLEFSIGPFFGSPELVRETQNRAMARIASTDLPRRVVDGGNLRWWGKWAAIALSAFAVVVWAFFPATLLLLQRVALSNVPLPTRTQVISVSSDEMVPAGTDLKLSARAEGIIPKSGRIVMHYGDGTRQEFSVTPLAEDPAVFSIVLTNLQRSFTYQFMLNDGRGTEHRVEVRQPPVVETVRVIQRYPRYTGWGETEMPAGDLTLMAGAIVRIEGGASLPLRSAVLQLEGVGQTIPLQTEGRGFSGEFSVPAEGLSAISFRLETPEGVVSRSDVKYPVELLPDRPPVVEILQPRDEQITVVSRTHLRIAFSIRDDFALKKAVLKYEVTFPALPDGTERPVKSGEIPLKVAAEGEGVLEWNLGTGTVPVTEGSRATYWIEATDNNDVTGPGVGRSARKVVEVISVEEKRRELLERLRAGATEIERISENQKDVNQNLDQTIRQISP